MPRPYLKLFIGGLILGLISLTLGSFIYYYIDWQNRQNQSQNQKITQLKNELDQTRWQLKALQEQLGLSQSQIEALEQKTQAAQSQLRQISKNTQELKTSTQSSARQLKESLESIEQTARQTSQLVQKLQQSGAKFTIQKLQETVFQIQCQDPNGQQRRGSGVLISSKGWLLTNAHVASQGGDGEQLSDCRAYQSFNSSEPPEAVFKLGTGYLSQEIDAALIRVTNTIGRAQPQATYPYLPLGDSAKTQIGEKVFVAGFPKIGDFTFNLTEGIISGKTEEFLKTDAKVDKGNSGGAALNKAGELIGLPTVAKVGEVESLGFLVKIDSVKEWLARCQDCPAL